MKDTREAWLLNAIDILYKEKFSPLGYKFHKEGIRVSVGFPSTKKAIGQWWSPTATTDNKSSIFIHPGEGDPIEVLGTLIHELCHDATPGKGHGKEFRACALAVGLEGKMRATTSTKELEEYFKGVSKKLGPFPHSPLKRNAKPPVKKQGTRMVKMSCSCGYIARASMTAILEHGPVICPCQFKPMEVDYE